MNQFFGNYLLNKGILTHVQFAEVLQRELVAKVKLGVLAFHAGLMTASQVEEIHHLQRMKDQKFGELAMSKGYLTRERVERLLESQQEGHLVLLQAIADLGFMTLAEVEKALADFREEYGISDCQQDTVLEKEILKKTVDFSAADDKAELYYDYVGLMLRNVVRFLYDTPVVFSKAVALERTPGWIVSQQIIGEVSFCSGLLMNESVLLELASRFYGEKLSAVDELALDSAGEFLNVNNGVFCNSLSEREVIVDLQPQCVRVNGTPIAAEAFRVTVGTSFGTFEIFLS
jgi:hypothetical protein